MPFIFPLAKIFQGQIAIMVHYMPQIGFPDELAI